ncbi:MAG: hypothetical protein B6I18_07820 [Bacteroidetes bacterium 4572_112]|nr:MAG: hypothetical protein B6I18_07820 [Bacteroidetes bacterium 4572_112]
MENIVNSILSKSKRLIDERKKLLVENEKLKLQVLDLQQKKSSQENKINELIEQQKIQQVAGVFGKEEKKTSLNKIDEVVREVDRCIALLNT